VCKITDRSDMTLSISFGTNILVQGVVSCGVVPFLDCSGCFISFVANRGRFITNFV
jgi:hypothetical protein